ncbi:MAG: serine O-acetyltransferase EpsC [Sphingomonadales bacterium]
MSVGNKKPSNFEEVVTEMTSHQNSFGEIPCISIEDAEKVLKHFLGLVFPHYLPNCDSGEKAIKKQLTVFSNDLERILEGLTGWKEKTIKEKVFELLTDLPGISRKIARDAEALFNSDPASQSLDEVILSYPGCYAVSAYRFAHYLLKMEIPLLPRLIGEYAHRVTGIDIHPGATIGHSLYIDHGTGVVIGETAIIGNNVQIYHSVTLGALKVEKSERSKKRHPTVEDNVIIYSGATILGGKTVIGHDSVIGGNVWITGSILPHSRVMYKSSDEAESGLNFTI